MDSASLKREIAALRKTVEQQRAETEALKSQLAWFQRQLFGRKSEARLVDSADPQQLGLFNTDQAEEPKPQSEEITYTRRKKGRDGAVTDQGLRFDDSIPVKVIPIPAPELHGADRDDYEVVGEKVSRRLAQRPGSYVIIEYRRPVVKRKSDQKLYAPAAPTAVFDRTMADVSLLAGMLVDKFRYHLPLYRQHQRLRAAGVSVSRSTLTNYVQRSIELLVPIYDAQWEHIVSGRVISVDETPIKAGRRRGRSPREPGQMKQAWFWPVYGEEDEVCFSWSPTRATSHIEEHLSGFDGVLLSDGYTAYDRFTKAKDSIVHAQCWAHARRYFERAEDSDPSAAVALDKIGAIYQVEREIRERRLEGDKLLRHRVDHAKPLVEGFLAWCRTERMRGDLIESAPLTKALKYAIKHGPQLQVYLGDPDVPIDNNHLERAIRTIAMGRKNWLFCWTELGARYVGVIQSLITTCILHQADPFTYLVDVLQRVATHPAGREEELTPRCWKELFSGQPLRSDLELIVG